MEVVFSKQCHCIIKNNLTQAIACKDKDEALLKANEMVKTLEDEACDTHLFFIKEENNKVVIHLKPNPNKSY